jgi:hypothetical protein
MQKMRPEIETGGLSMGLLGAVFGKRTASPVATAGPTPVHSNQTPPPQSPVPSDGKGAGIVIVKASAVKAARYGTDYYPLVQSVIDFVNAALHEMHYARPEIAQRALQVYHADYYLAQVNNGGHSQFIRNTGGNAQYTFSDALEGLTAMRAPHAGIIKDMMMWVAKNPKDAAKQDGFENRAPYLDTLDTAFYAADKKDGMIKLSALWIQGWPELKIVEDDDYLAEMRKLGERNAMRAKRQLLKDVLDLAGKTIDHFQVATGLLLTSMEKKEFLIGTGKGSYKDIEGRQEMAFLILTNAGKRQVVIGEKNEDVRLYEYFDPDNEKLQELVRTQGFEKSFAFHKSAEYRPPKLGGRMALLPQQVVSDVISFSNSSSAGIAIAMILHKLNLLREGPTLAAYPIAASKEGRKVIRWQIVTNKGVVEIGTLADGAIATYNSVSQTDLPKVVRAEIDAFLQDCMAKAGV